ncbi:MAG: class I SAM-dependent methyltransferase [Pirellulales bacterium]|nr:class I SAM-dependent methyltransferase [Planctomycetales bacterium]
MITCPSVRKDVIRDHYDVGTLFYRLFWGSHIHHGYWEADESPAVAQDQLTDRLADLAGVESKTALLDVGCGMGASSRRLASLRRCHATGVTISRVQRRWATTVARLRGLSRQTTFLCADAETISFPAASFDTVWSIECTEHLFNKPRFFQRAAGWLKPGGRLAICAWLAGDNLDESRRQQVYDVCEGFFCPSLGTRADYEQWISESGLVVEHSEDWTARVMQTWEICSRRIHRYSLHRLAGLVRPSQLIFLDRFDTILNAYRSGAMQYGCFIARKPLA